MNNKKTILYLVTQSELGGVQQYIYDLAANLRDEFNIVVAFGEQGKSGELAKKLDVVGIQNFEIPHLKRAISPKNDMLAIFEIAKLIKKIKPDIIHLNSSKISVLGSLATFIVSKFKIQNSKLIYTVHGWVFNEPMSNSKKIFYKYAEKFTALLKDKLICVSEYDRQIALKEKIAPKNKLVTIHNGIEEIDFFLKDEAIYKLLSTFNFQLSTIIIGTIANLYQTKGFEYLIQAAKILKDDNLNFKLVIIGEGDERKKLEELIDNQSLRNEIILTGRINNASKLLKAFDVFVCSSVKEGFPYNIIEAMQAGLPIVSTNVGGIGEMITNEINGLLVEPKNPKELAKKIKTLIQNEELSRRLGQNAKEKSVKEFTLESMVNKTKNVYITSNQ